MERTTETRRSGVRGEDEGKHEGDEKPGGLAGGPVEWRLAVGAPRGFPPTPPAASVSHAGCSFSSCPFGSRLNCALSAEAPRAPVPTRAPSHAAAGPRLVGEFREAGVCLRLLLLAPGPQ